MYFLCVPENESLVHLSIDKLCVSAKLFFCCCSLFVVFKAVACCAYTFPQTGSVHIDAHKQDGLTKVAFWPTAFPIIFDKKSRHRWMLLAIWMFFSGTDFPFCLGEISVRPSSHSHSRRIHQRSFLGDLNLEAYLYNVW